ncbi:MAG: hypothetical protein IJU03_09395 [Thermoguttaceae bacterium]|nr:hypothetical protein [Thermoguttaceae bacterium]
MSQRRNTSVRFVALNGNFSAATPTLEIDPSPMYNAHGISKRFRNRTLFQPQWTQLMTHSRIGAALVAAFISLALYAATSFAGERILVVGDSITGHSMNLPYGYAHEIRNALKDAGSDMEFVPLGGSGQTIFSWRNIIKNSYENNFRLDIEGIMIKEEFDKGADAILVHLGMNDALQPSIKSDEEGFKSWRAEYKALVADLRARVPSVKRIILTPPTLLTENPYAFKNLFMDRLAEIIADVAQEEDCEFYNARAEFAEHFVYARTRDPKFRITLDFVHPNQYGHQIMAWSFLKALKLGEIADKYYQEKVDPIVRDLDDKPAMALFVNDLKSEVSNLYWRDAIANAEDSICAVEIAGRFFNVPDGAVIKIEGDDVVCKNITGTKPGEFTASLTLPIHELSTEVVVKAGELAVPVRVNAPYYVLTGFPMDAYSYPELDKFPKDKATNKCDQLIAMTPEELGNITKEQYEEFCAEAQSAYFYYPTTDKTGADNPNAVDLADLAPANAFDAAYVLRVVFSPKAQKATLVLNTEGFSTTTYQRVYLNGQEIYFDCLSPRSPKWKDTVEVELREGANIIGARVDHTHWQWGVSFSFEGAEGLTY